MRSGTGAFGADRAFLDLQYNMERQE